MVVVIVEVAAEQEVVAAAVVGATELVVLDATVAARAVSTCLQCRSGRRHVVSFVVVVGWTWK